MKGVPRALGATPWLAAIVVVLLPTLAWLQYDWVNQLATADRERRGRTLRAAGAQFTAAVDAEISRLGGGLQLDGAMVERRDWDAYALRYDAALEGGTSGLDPQVWFAEIDEAAATPEARIALRHWDPSSRVFEPVDWPSALQPLRAQLLAVPDHEAHADRRGPREFFAAVGGVGDERTLVMPVLRVQTPRDAARAPDRFVTDVRMRGYTIVRLDVDALARERLPQLAAEHFPGAAEYRVAVVANTDDRVLFESAPGAAADTATDPDLITTFLQPRLGPMMIVARVGNGAAQGDARIDRVPPPPPELDGAPADRSIVSMVEVRDRDGQRTVRTRSMQGRGRGHWTLRVKHAAGSLEAAVVAARRRNLLLSGGSLALLGVVVALIAVSARRAQGLARQHMEFVAAVSHELRTPVAVINSAAGNLADGVVADPGRVKKYGETIQGEARRLGETVERVLQLAGLGSGRPLPVAPLAVDTLVHDAVSRLSSEAARAGVDVQVHVAPGLPAVAGDAGTLLSAVQNLVGNAIKYAGHDRWVRVTATAAGGSRPEVRIGVEDHGAGLGADERRKVFEPFYRGRDAVANQVQGSGLGLSLVQRIADAHGGRVELVTEPGRGSTFTLCLPVAPDRPETSSAPAAAGSEAAAPSAP